MPNCSWAPDQLAGARISPYRITSVAKAVLTLAWRSCKCSVGAMRGLHTALGLWTKRTLELREA
ncbi:hypothetical protein ACFVAF_37350 [Streptomyces sp. NPDC057596]|uniref:hypothetical protein n=1 Tax=Streptomyces sp. NPDC057596 TaxID=3346178 RepID=UPI00368ED5F3